MDSNTSMQDLTVATELIDHLCRNSRLTALEAEHVAQEVLAYYSQTPDQFIRQRHHELQSLGYSNKQIFTLLQDELAQRRFSSKPLTTRQIRRAIYG